MQEIVIHHWCDICGGTGSSRVEAQQHDFTITGKPLTIDLCQTHYDETLGRLVDVAVVDHSDTGDRSPGGKLRRTCPVCGGDFTNVTQHVAGKHPGVVPTGWFTCPCGVATPTKQGIQTHGQRAHDGVAPELTA